MTLISIAFFIGMGLLAGNLLVRPIVDPKFDTLNKWLIKIGALLLAFSIIGSLVTHQRLL